MSAWTGSDSERISRRTFRDTSLQKQLEEAGYATLPMLDSAVMARLAQAWLEHDTAIHERPFHASCMSNDVPYRLWLADLLIPILREHLNDVLVDHKLLFSNFVVKRAGSTIDVTIHQDPTFADETQCRGLTLWIPLVDVTPENGCLKVIPGSHLLNGKPRGSAQAFPYPDRLESFRPLFVDVLLKAGEAFIMDSRLFHWSAGNATETHRICLGAVAIPNEHAAWYCYQPQLSGTEVEVYEVADDYYHTFVFGMPPAEGMVPVTMLPCAAEPLTDDRIASFVAFSEALA